MDYPLENLGSARFQRVCQALLAKEFPAARLMPITNQDGGRDAFVRRIVPNGGRGGLVVFQVKYAESPASLDDPRAWVRKNLEKELPKIKRLLPRGLQHYRLITNVGGSAHLGTGSIDKLDDLLAQLPCPADGWWRDDLLGRLDDAWDIKWSFPELFTGPDLLRAIIDSGLTENKERRSSAISAFLADQYEEDARVKFKQVELENRLLDLYVDVELTASPSQTPRGRAALQLVATMAGEGRYARPFRAASQFRLDEAGPWGLHRPSVGAAQLLLADLGTSAPHLAVIEGAPGQGKSTVTQYVCQVHRMRLLGRQEDLDLVAETHRSGPLRLPFRVDLRDLAGWLHGRNPFGDSFGADSAVKRTLETFFAAQVELASGGVEFSVSDLHAVSRISSLLLIFDGLDEVADIDERRSVVREVTAGIRRLRQVSPSLQAVATSRPVAFENSPGFAKDAFDYFELVDLDSSNINEYADRWITARGLRRREASDVRSVLENKLSQPHMRELARNPMQLAILLSLINRRGPSLPDKRTALYDSYVSTFFDREAEKTEDVQRHRELLVELHQYLAWHLQATAEKGRSQGSISEEDLRILLIAYLTREEKDPRLIDTLFKSLVERVVAIVSRVQGTYEFEVQPLREYFAARYLYDTAHYSPTGAERSGDKTDRFDALARNFYWLNATRFFAGCFSRGELSSLTELLRDLAADPKYGQTDQPRLLSMMLLSDWVFAQHPKSVKTVVELVLENFPSRSLTRTQSSMVLPAESGQRELTKRCWELLDAPDTLPRDREVAVVKVLTANCDERSLDEEWLVRVQAHGGLTRKTWLRRGMWTRSLDRASPETVQAVVGESDDATLLHQLVEADHGLLIDQNAEWAKRTIDALLNGEIRGKGRASGRPNSIVDAFSRIVEFLPDVWEQLSDWWSEHGVRLDIGSPSDEAKRCEYVLTVFREQFVGDPSHWWSSLASWNQVVEAFRDTWGECWLAIELAVGAAGIVSSNARGSIGDGFFDASHPLCERARYARLRAGASSWWGRKLSEAPTRLDETMLVALFFAWASKKTLVSAMSPFDRWIQNASDLERKQIRAAITRRGRLDSRRQTGTSFDLQALGSVSPETAGLLMFRANSLPERLSVAERYLGDYAGDDVAVLRMLADTELAATQSDKQRWAGALEACRRAYPSGAVPTLGASLHELSDLGLPYDLAQSVVSDADKYPLSIVSVAEGVCREEVGRTVEAVSDVAVAQGW